MTGEPGNTEGSGPSSNTRFKTAEFSGLKPQTSRQLESLKVSGVGPDTRVNADQLRQLRVNQLKVDALRKRI